MKKQEEVTIVKMVDFYYCEICDKQMPQAEDGSFTVRIVLVKNDEKGILYFHEDCLFDKYMK